MKIRYNIFLFCILILVGNANSQNKAKTDSLLLRTRAAIHDTEKVKTFFGLYTELRKTESEKALGYLNEALALSESKNYKKGIQAACIEKGSVYCVAGKYDSAIYFCKKGIEAQDSTFPKNKTAFGWNIIAVAHFRKGDHAKALSNLLRSVKIHEECGAKASVANTLNNLAVMYLEIKNPEQALEVNLRCISLSLETKNYSILASAYQNRGVIYQRTGVRDSVILYYTKSAEVAEKNNDFHLVARNFYTMGAFFSEEKSHYQAIDYLSKALKLFEEQNNTQGMTEVMMYLANSYLALKDVQKAEAYLNRAEQNAKTLGIVRELSEVYSVQSLVYEEKGDFKKALEKYKQFKLLHDSVFNNESSKQITEMNAKYESDKKDKEILLLNKEKIIKESAFEAEKAKSEKQSFQLKASLGGFLLVLAFAVITLKGYKEKQKINKVIEAQKMQVEEKNKNITDSINYAKRIQDIILPAGNLLDDIFPDHFILFKPKDIVSGDFYWSTIKNEYFFLAVCDSTGHGVPGAFMSLLNIGFLSEAINEKNISDPGQVFDYVRGRLITSISKEGQKDGFDGVLLRYHLQTREVCYSASNNAPLIISNGEITELKKDKMPVGLGEKQEQFTTFVPELKTNDILYIYTDGYADQFGGSKGKKLMYRQLHQYILSVSSEPLHRQKELLNDNLENWRGKLEQVDDVLIAGIKI